MLRRSQKAQPAAAAAPTPRAPTVPAGPVAVTVEVPVAAEQLRGWFLDPERWTRFQGRRAWIDPVLGGRLRVEMADGVFTAGTFLEIGDRHLAFTWGREGDSTMPVGSTTVSVDLHPTVDGTRIELVHDGLADRSLAEEHAGGWRYHLIRLGAAASGVDREGELIDLFLAATHEPDAIARRGLLERTCAADVEVADGHDDTRGIPSLAAKLGRLVQGEPAVRLVRLGDVERVGALLRCEYALRRGAEELVERGELVAGVDRQHRLGAVSLFGSAGRAATAARGGAGRGGAPSRGPAAPPPRGW